MYASVTERASLPMFKFDEKEVDILRCGIKAIRAQREFVDDPAKLQVHKMIDDTQLFVDLDKARAAQPLALKVSAPIDLAQTARVAFILCQSAVNSVDEATEIKTMRDAQGLMSCMAPLAQLDHALDGILLDPKIYYEAQPYNVFDECT